MQAWNFLAHDPEKLQAFSGKIRRKIEGVDGNVDFV